jgi:molybdate transport system substrate-binding protein
VTTSDQLAGEIVVFASSSLTEAFTAIGHDLERANPGTRIVLSFGSAPVLATQIVHGAPADVFAAASEQDMARVVSAGVAVSPTLFARNSMRIVVPPANPGRVADLNDLSRPGVKVALCASNAPCGRGAEQVFDRAGITVTPVTREVNVKATLTKVELGEVDAGVVYVTDARAAEARVRSVAIPDHLNSSTRYPVAVLPRARNPALARAFVDAVLSADGARVLRDAGFEQP